MRWMRHVAVWAAALGIASAPRAASADPIAEFYKGKQISSILSAGEGGGYSSYARELLKKQCPTGEHFMSDPDFTLTWCGSGTEDQGAATWKQGLQAGPKTS